MALRTRWIAALLVGARFFVFLFLVKICLAWWCVRVRHVNPLADVPRGRAILVVGADAFLAFAVSLLFLFLFRVGQVHRALRTLFQFIIPAVVYLGLVFFTVLSFQVARIYGSPLDVQILRSGGDLATISGSLRGYADPVPMALIGVGLVSYFIPASKRAGSAPIGNRRVVWTLLGGVCGALAGRAGRASRRRHIWH